MALNANHADDVIGKMFASLAQGEMDIFRACFEPDAVIWHNFDDVEQDLDATIVGLRHFCSLTVTRGYEAQRISRVGDEAFSQHVLTATLPSGGEMRLPVLMRIAIGASGLISRVDEYFDSRGADCLQAERPAAVSTS